MGYWTTKEVAVLRETYPSGGSAAVKKLLPHRSVVAIRQKALNLNITSDYHHRRGIEGSWNDRKIKFGMTVATFAIGMKNPSHRELMEMVCSVINEIEGEK